MPAHHLRESHLALAFGAFADAPTVRLPIPTQQVPLAEAFAAFQHPVQPLYERLLAVFETHPFPFDPTMNKLQHFDYREALGTVRTSLQQFTQAVESKSQDVESLGNGVQVAYAINQVIGGQMYRNMGDFSGSHMGILLDIFDQTRVNLAVVLLENVTDASLAALYRAVPGLEKTLRGMPSRDNIRLHTLATRDYHVRQALKYVDTRTRGYRSDRRTLYMPAVPKINS